MCKLKHCFKVSIKERKEAVYGVKSPSSGVRDHGQDPNSLPHLLHIQQASCFTSLSLSTMGITTDLLSCCENSID